MMTMTTMIVDSLELSASTVYCFHIHINLHHKLQLSARYEQPPSTSLWSLILDKPSKKRKKHSSSLPQKVVHPNTKTRGSYVKQNSGEGRSRHIDVVADGEAPPLTTNPATMSWLWKLKPLHLADEKDETPRPMVDGCEVRTR
jgi:hypothetical protein